MYTSVLFHNCQVKLECILQAYLERDLQLEASAVAWVQENLMSSCEKAEDSELPNTGMPQEIEKKFSSIFIEPLNFQGKLYGTHTQTVVTGWADGHVEYHEKALYSARNGESLRPAKTSSIHLSVPITNDWRTR